MRDKCRTLMKVKQSGVLIVSALLPAQGERFETRISGFVLSQSGCLRHVWMEGLGGEGTCGGYGIRLFMGYLISYYIFQL